MPLSIDQKDIEYVDTFQYLGSYTTSTGDVDVDIRARIGKLQYSGEYTMFGDAAISARTQNRRCLRNILRSWWKDHVTNDDLLQRAKLENLRDKVDRRRRDSLATSVLRILPARPVSITMQWTVKVGKEEIDLRRHTTR